MSDEQNGSIPENSEQTQAFQSPQGAVAPDAGAPGTTGGYGQANQGSQPAQPTQPVQPQQVYQGYSGQPFTAPAAGYGQPGQPGQYPYPPAGQPGQQYPNYGYPQPVKPVKERKPNFFTALFDFKFTQRLLPNYLTILYYISLGAIALSYVWHVILAIYMAVRWNEYSRFVGDIGGGWHGNFSGPFGVFNVIVGGAILAVLAAIVVRVILEALALLAQIAEQNKAGAKDGGTNDQGNGSGNQATV